MHGRVGIGYARARIQLARRRPTRHSRGPRGAAFVLRTCATYNLAFAARQNMQSQSNDFAD
eukprot:11228118-Lingulodinium_polyedra.AAC.1